MEGSFGNGTRSPSIIIRSSSQQHLFWQPAGQRRHVQWQQQSWQPAYRGPQLFSMQSHSQHSLKLTFVLAVTVFGPRQHMQQWHHSGSSRCGPQQMHSFIRLHRQRQTMSQHLSASGPHSHAHHCSSSTQHFGPQQMQHGGAHALMSGFSCLLPFSSYCGRGRARAVGARAVNANCAPHYERTSVHGRLSGGSAASSAVGARSRPRRCFSRSLSSSVQQPME